MTPSCSLYCGGRDRSFQDPCHWRNRGVAGGQGERGNKIKAIALELGELPVESGAIGAERREACIAWGGSPLGLATGACRGWAFALPMNAHHQRAADARVAL
jgi:hypothetical protein